mgnify:CR=1 FL=1
MQRSALLCIACLGLLSACPDGGNETAGEETTPVTSILPDFTTGISDSSTGMPPTTSGVDPGTGSSGDGSSTTEDLSCKKIMIEAVPEIPQVMLVLDKSGSMIGIGKTEEPGEIGDGFWDHDNDANTPEITRWKSLYAVVESMFAGLDSVISFGAVLFPSTSAISTYGPEACPVDAAPLVPVGPMSGASILAAIPAADSADLAGGTPATAGMKAAIGELQELDPAHPRLIVLITDGAANCREDAADNTQRFETYDDKLPLTVADAKTMGFPTYVIGIDILDVTSPMQTDGNPDNTNTFQRLNELAEAGGTARAGDEKFFNASNQIELQAALMEITKAIVSCEIPLGEPVPTNYYIELLQVGGVDNPESLKYPGMDTQVSDCAAESGWIYKDPAVRDTVILCGDACDYYKQTGLIDIKLGCFIP